MGFRINRTGTRRRGLSGTTESLTTSRVGFLLASVVLIKTLKTSCRGFALHSFRSVLSNHRPNVRSGLRVGSTVGPEPFATSAKHGVPHNVWGLWWLTAGCASSLFVASSRTLHRRRHLAIARKATDKLAVLSLAPHISTSRTFPPRSVAVASEDGVYTELIETSAWPTVLGTALACWPVATTHQLTSLASPNVVAGQLGGCFDMIDGAAFTAPKARRRARSAHRVGKSRRCAPRRPCSGRRAATARRCAQRQAGAKLQQDGALPVVPSSFDASCLRTQIQLGLRRPSRMRCCKKGHEVATQGSSQSASIGCRTSILRKLQCISLQNAIDFSGLVCSI